jgi:hypothetical protein
MFLSEVAGSNAMKLYKMVAEQLLHDLEQLQKDWPDEIETSWTAAIDSTYKLPTITVYIETPRVDQAASEMADIIHNAVPTNGIQPCRAEVHTILENMGKALYHITVGPL